MKRIKERQCRCCTDLFSPDYRNAQRQEYCAKPECRQASKVASQQRWLNNNPNYFKGPEHVIRVREWRMTNPGRSRHKKSGAVLQEICDQISSDKQDVAPHLLPVRQASPTPAPVLQDFCLTQLPIFVGLIAHLTGCVLQEDIDVITRRLEQLGHDVRGSKFAPGGSHDVQDSPSPRSYPRHPLPVQLGGSPSGP